MSDEHRIPTLSDLEKLMEGSQLDKNEFIKAVFAQLDRMSVISSHLIELIIHINDAIDDMVNDINCHGMTIDEVIEDGQIYEYICFVEGELQNLLKEEIKSRLSK